MIRIFLALAAFASLPSFAESGDCLDRWISGQINRDQYNQCVQQRTQTSNNSTQTAQSTSSPVMCFPVMDPGGRPCTDPNHGRACNVGGSNQGNLSSQQIVQLMWLYYLGFLSKDQLASYLFMANPWQYYLLTHIYGDRAVDVFLSQYQMQFYNQLFANAGNGQFNPWLFASLMNQLQPR